MVNLRSVRVASKASKRPFMMLFTSDYRDGTARLPFDQKGFYMQILTLLHDGERVPSDAKKLGVMMQCDPRAAARLSRALIAAGKLYEENGELRNKRIDRDIGATSDGSQPEIDETSDEDRAEVDTKSERKNPKHESNQDPEKHTIGDTTSNPYSISNPIPETSVVPEAARGCAAKIDLDDLENRLREACNGALASPAIAQGLFDLSTPLMWLNQGCDLDLDVIPTLRGIGKREHGKAISSWGYFTKPVTAAKARRLEGLPEVAVEASARPDARAAYQAARAQMLAEEAVH